MQPDLADKLSRAGVDKESALYKAAARIQSRFRGYTVRKVGCMLRALCIAGSSAVGHVGGLPHQSGDCTEGERAQSSVQSHLGLEI